MATETIVINSFPKSSVSVRSRTSKKGKVSRRTTIEIEAEPIVHTFNEMALGAEPAEAIRMALRKGIQDINQPVSTSTKTFRKSARTAYEAGRGWAAIRYRPIRGQQGPANPPNHASRAVLFNDSGRLADGLFVRQNTSQKNFTINVPTTRLTDDTRFLAEKLVTLVPGLKNPASLLRDKGVKKAVERSQKLVIAKARNETDLRRVKLRQAQLNAAKAVIGALRSIAGL